jgi:hypothetical protein
MPPNFSCLLVLYRQFEGAPSLQLHVVHVVMETGGLKVEVVNGDIGELTDHLH